MREHQTITGDFCLGEVHVYPKAYSGDPQYAEEFFSHCLCGKKKKVTTVVEIDYSSAPPTTAIGKGE